jgi:hypothetical protein
MTFPAAEAKKSTNVLRVGFGGSYAVAFYRLETIAPANWAALG